MRQYDILKAAANVDLDKLKDEEREPNNAVTMLMRVVNGSGRKVLERMAAKLGSRETIRMLRELGERLQPSGTTQG